MTNDSYNTPRYEQRRANDAPMTTVDWIITMLLLCIPLVNFILLLVWAFSSDTNLNKKTYSRATLIFMLIAFVIGFFFALLIPLLAAAAQGAAM